MLLRYNIVTTLLDSDVTLLYNVNKYNQNQTEWLYMDVLECNMNAKRSQYYYMIVMVCIGSFDENMIEHLVFNSVTL